ncbi:MAG: tRNA (adenosine(37)-N6)-dimethylallyltransferase MiaA [Bryobacterales bacterium]|nr:tRNA (adenosine(37)-N6)-dimethylallyltransferase MiaA [Bryobacterales bacterium]
MPETPEVAPLLVIAGPTGSGKSDLSLSIAAEYDGEVVNCDSVQIYRCFDIGSAKLPVSERRGIPHHLIDICEPDEVFTAGDYSRLARRVIGGIASRGRLPIVVGGTGFYLRAFLHGLFEGPPRDEHLRARLAKRQIRRPGILHRLLRRRDPVAAKRIHPNDVNKTIRALEVVFTAGRPLTEMFAEGSQPLSGFRVLNIGLNPPREALYERLNRRTERIFELGIVDETRSILARGYPDTAKPFESLGYAQALRVVKGEWTVDEAIAATQLETRRYAKRQWTWFRRERDMHWIDGFGDQAYVQQLVSRTVTGFLQIPPEIL